MASSISKAFFWSGLEQVGTGGMRFVLSIILARLLTPSEFGLMGMLMVFLLIAQIFVDSGLSMGLIQGKEISSDDEVSVLCVNVAAGVALAIVLCVISPLVARFYRQPILVPLLCVSSIGVLVGSLGVVQTALLNRAMDFRTQAKIMVFATICSGVIGVGMAWKGYGVWSLVGQSVTQSVAQVGSVWMLARWRPTGQFRWSSVARLWPFSSRLLASGFLNAAFQNLYSLVIGRFYTPADLGFYTRASTLAMFPASSVTTVVGRVMLPVFSRVQDEGDRLKQELRRAIRLTSALYFPLMAGLAAVAEPLVLCLLTEKWLPCVPYFRLLCVDAMFYPLHAMHLNVLAAQGRSDLFLRLELVKKALVVSTLAVTSWIGIYAMVVGLLANSVVCLAINGYYTSRLIRYTRNEQMRDLSGFAVASLGMAILVWSWGYLSAHVNSWALLGTQVLLGAVLYWAAMLILRGLGYEDVWSVLRRVRGHGGAPAESPR